MNLIDEDMKLYHGTKVEYATKILAGEIDLTKGGGELGQGFYAGDLLHQVKAWAYQKSEGKIADMAVIKLSIPQNVFYDIQTLLLDRNQAINLRKRLRMSHTQRTHIIDRFDAVWSPVVGRRIPDYNQLKFQSKQSIDILRTKIKKQII